MFIWLRDLTKYFIFIYLIIFIVQRKNVDEFNYKLTAIQSGILLGVFVVVNGFLEWYFGKYEKFEMELNDKDYKCDMMNNDNKIMCSRKQKLSLKCPEEKKEEPKCISDDTEFNKDFDDYVMNKIPFDKCGDAQEPQYIRDKNKLDYNVRNEHYNTNVGYTYMDPKTFRVGQQAQPPICLTTTPCSTQPVMINTSMGKEFLPYSVIKSNTQSLEDKKIRKCKIDTVYDA